MKKELATLRKENKKLMVNSSLYMSRWLTADRKLSGVMSHVKGGFSMWLPRVDDRTHKEMERVREKIEEIANG